MMQRQKKRNMVLELLIRNGFALAQMQYSPRIVTQTKKSKRKEKVCLNASRGVRIQKRHKSAKKMGNLF
jgi:hypothetical protein